MLRKRQLHDTHTASLSIAEQFENLAGAFLATVTIE